MVAFAPERLTGMLVEHVRTKHKLSRAQFSELAGLVGKSTARLSNIERKDSWKPGDRERVAAALNQLQPNFDPQFHDIADVAIDAPNQETLPPIAMTSNDDADDTFAVLEEVVEAPSPVLPTVVMPTSPVVDVDPLDGMYVISNSEVQTWKRCRRKWWLAHYRRLALRNEAFVGVRATGTRLHRALEQWYVPDGQPRVDPRDALERLIVDDWTTINEAAVARGFDPERTQALARDFAEANNLERAMIEGYVQWLEETGADAELRVIASETPLSVDVDVKLEPSDADAWSRTQVRQVRLIGKLDARLYRVSDGVRLFMDHKTLGDIKSPAQTLPMNEQMLHYHLLEWLASDDADERCDGALYNMLKRVKRSTRAQPPFYDRIEVRHNVHELEAYRRHLMGVTGDVLRAVDALDYGRDHQDVAYPSPRSDCRWDCDFFAVCNLFDDGSAGVNDMVNVFYHKVDPHARYRSDDQVIDE